MTDRRGPFITRLIKDARVKIDGIVAVALRERPLSSFASLLPSGEVLQCLREGAFITSKSWTVQFKLEITRRHPILGARSQHLGGGW